jgi:C_GCAxxG_C_C family probable redox protein
VSTDPKARARELFLRADNTYGCAEVALVTLQEHWGLPAAADSSPAMALNGGVAYSGGPCGAITGAALAVGRLAEARCQDHREAKRVARTLVQRLMAGFREVHGATDCRDLTGYDMTTDHAAFIRSGIWREVCMRQLEYAVEFLAPLGDEGVWEEAVGASPASRLPSPADPGSPVLWSGGG